MLTGDAESLARWALSLEDTIRQADAELARPLRSPWLRCACAAFQAARLCRVVRDGLAVTSAGLALARDTARAGRDVEAARARAAAWTAGYTVGRAGVAVVRAAGLACAAGWSGWGASRAAPRPSFAQLARRTVYVCRAALFVIGGNKHDRL